MTIQKPNIIYILTDQQRRDTLSCYSGTQCQTPFLDQLSEESVVFDNAYTSCPVCTPARATIQTGLYPHRHGMETNNYAPGCMVHELPDRPELLSRRLQQQNYSLGYTGKWHLGAGQEIKDNHAFKTMRNDVYFAELEQGITSLPTTLGYEGDDFGGHGGAGLKYTQFQKYLKDNGLTHGMENRISGIYHGHFAAEITTPIESTIDYYLTEQAIHYINEFKDRDKPFYFQLNYWGPHEPYLAPSEFLDLYREMNIEPWPNFYEQDQNKPSIHDAKRANYTEWEQFVPYIKHYYAFMTSIDAQIGRLIDYLKQNDLYDNTVIIFAADHGESLGIHGGLCDKAFFMYDETCRIPLMIKPASKLDKSQRIENFVGTCDIYSTILEYSGISRKETEMDGRSLVPLIQGEQVPDWPDHIVTEGSGLEQILFTQRMIRKGNMKYIFNCGEIDELYDLSRDPHEMTNQIRNPDYQSILIDMKKTLAGWMEEHNDGALRQFKLLRCR